MTGEQFKAERNRRGLSLDALSKRLGTATRTVVQWEAKGPSRWGKALMERIDEPTSVERLATAAGAVADLWDHWPDETDGEVAELRDALKGYKESVKAP